MVRQLYRLGSSERGNQGNGIMLSESLSKGTTHSKHKGYHRGYNQAIMEIVDNIDKNSKCDRERLEKFNYYNPKFIRHLSQEVCLYINQ